jgi:hypothetical protein
VLIDVENGGAGGKTQVIFMPQLQKHAQAIFQEFHTLTKCPNPSEEMEEEDDSMAYHSNTCTYQERMQEIFR